MKLFVCILLFFIACSGQDKNNDIKNVNSLKIKKISFHEVSLSFPLDEKEEIIEVYEIIQDSIFKVQKKFSYQKLIQSKVLISKADNNQSVLYNIPEKYINDSEKYSFLNYYPENDGGYIQITILFTDNSEKKWNISYNPNDLPNDLLLIFELFEKSKKSLNSI